MSILMNLLSLFAPHRTALPDPVTKYEGNLYHAVAALLRGDLATAKEQLHLAIADNTESAPAYNLLGVAEAMAGNQSLALRYYRVALVLDPTYEPARTNLVRPTDSTARYDLGLE
jgi:Flp pilus assembly protein TadD